ncbi:hypothetical protein SVIO_037670 [Streptomyces violaceusniger]|uniref:Uncharacterized protein n=1 Tax=Streptomyces violaceusniger TaxID=68280 RepID=A0A4D4KY93_STRVO|nr:hypothetical protein SVIO_037670 [Streptomyces violaceusniger]
MFQEGIHEPEGDHVVAVGVQWCPVLELDVQAQPPGGMPVLGGCLGEGVVGPVDGVDVVAERGQMGCELSDPAPDIESLAVDRGGKVRGKQ